MRTKTDNNAEKVVEIEGMLFLLGSRNVRILETDNGDLFIEEGCYRSLDEADKRRHELEEKMKKEGITLFIEKRGISDIPKGMLDNDLIE